MLRMRETDRTRWEILGDLGRSWEFLGTEELRSKSPKPQLGLAPSKERQKNIKCLTATSGIARIQAIIG